MLFFIILFSFNQSFNILTFYLMGAFWILRIVYSRLHLYFFRKSTFLLFLMSTNFIQKFNIVFRKGICFHSSMLQKKILGCQGFHCSGFTSFYLKPGRLTLHPTDFCRCSAWGGLSSDARLRNRDPSDSIRRFPNIAPSVSLISHSGFLHRPNRILQQRYLNTFFQCSCPNISPPLKMNWNELTRNQAENCQNQNQEKCENQKKCRLCPNRSPTLGAQKKCAAYSRGCAFIRGGRLTLYRTNHTSQRKADSFFTCLWNVPLCEVSEVMVSFRNPFGKINVGSHAFLREKYASLNPQ